VPAALMARINELATDATAPPAIGRHALVEQSGGDGGGDGKVCYDAGLHEADAERGRKRLRRTADRSTETSSSCSGETTSDGDVFASDDDGFNLPPPCKKPAKVQWDKGAPLLRYGEALDEPALGTTGGVTGEERRLVMSLPLLPHVPGTVASMLKILEFVRAVTVDPAFVWAPQGSWAAVDAVLGVLQASNFSVAALAAVLRLPVVKEQRLLRGAVACFGPGLEADRQMRKLLAAVLKALKRREVEYDKWVGDAGGVVALDGSAVEALRLEMAAAHPLKTFSHKSYTGAWLLPPATVAAYRSVYSEYTDQWDDYLRTGVWAPGLPVLRPMPSFSGVATANTDLPDCNHLMGAENSHTGGTVGVFCTCSHPKFLGVMVLTGSESQRMPLEFVAQRFVKMPLTIIYDFACATLKSALVRLPWMARWVALKCDRFHWGENHTDCSAALSPNSYESMDSINTSSCEERNALSRRQQHHLRQMKQDQFITFTVYQQAVSNAVAMHRDSKTLGAAYKWPEWYRRSHVDVVGTDGAREGKM